MWQDIQKQHRSELLDAIPDRWKLSTDHGPSAGESKAMLGIPESCGLLTPEQMSITRLDALELLQQLHSGALTSVQVTEAFCARAAVAHQLVNCLTEFFPEEAMQDARDLDAAFKKSGPVGKLHGLPVSIKDDFDMTGRRTTKGIIALKDMIADTDCGIVELLRAEGAVFYARTTMPQSGMAVETNSNLWGRTVSPFNPSMSAGGSSGGEAALLALRGSPLGLGSDIGGSIRVPCAFNGLYGIRPTAERTIQSGMRSIAPGQTSIKGSVGPLCHTFEDLKYVTKLMLPTDPHEYDASTIPVLWRDISPLDRKLRIGVMEWDGAVQPHPPIKRSIQETVEKLLSAGHEAIEFPAPFDCVEAAKVAMKLLIPTGFGEGQELMRSAGDPIIPVVQKLLDTFEVRPSTVKEQMKCNVAQAQYKQALREAWKATAQKSSHHRPIDVLICPVSPNLNYEHDVFPWWGYTLMFNLTDFPSTVIPLKNFKISSHEDPPAHMGLVEASIPSAGHYDPELLQDMPVGIQIVGLPYQDEELLAASEVVDRVINTSIGPLAEDG